MLRRGPIDLGAEDADDGGAPHDVPLEAVEVAACAGVSWRVVAMAAALVGLIAALAMIRPSPADDAAPTTTSETTPTTTIVAADEMLRRLPAGPLDGRDSWKLPVVALPQAGVVDGQPVTMVGRGFSPGESVGIVMCAAEAAGEGVAACDLGSNGTFDRVTYANADAAGNVVGEVVVRRSITTPATGPVDCLESAERCLVAIGAVADYDRSGGSFVGFAGAPPFPPTQATVSPLGPYEPGQTVTVTADGLLGPRDVQIRQCRDEQCVVRWRGDVGPEGTISVPVVVEPNFVTSDGVNVACEGGCVLRIEGIGVPGASAAPMPAPLPLSFGGPPPTTSATPMTTTPTTVEATSPLDSPAPSIAPTTAVPDTEAPTTAPPPDTAPPPTPEAPIVTVDLIVPTGPTPAEPAD